MLLSKLQTFTLTHTVRLAMVRLRNYIRTTFARINPSPILILGNQKSGTTAIAAILAKATGLSVTLDLEKEQRKPLLPLVRHREITIFRFIQINKYEFSKDIIKEPSLTFFYQDLADYFPSAKFVFIVRDPRDNIRSILDRHKIPGNLLELQPEHRRRLNPAWQLVFDGTWLNLNGNNYIEMLADRWNLATDIYLKHRKKFVLVRYEDFLCNKIDSIAQLAKSIGLVPAHNIAGEIDVQYQPAGNRNVKWNDFFGEVNLATIEDLCANRMQLLGYTTHRETGSTDTDESLK